jgi:ATP-binding cassette subfamily B protein
MILFVAARRIKQEQYETMKTYAQVESFYFDSLGGINDILSFNASSSFAKSNTFFYENFQSKAAKLGLTQAKVSLYAELAAGALIMGTLTFGAISVINESLLLGQMMATYALLANMVPAVNRFVEANIALQGASIAARRLMDLLLVQKEKNTGDLHFKMKGFIKIVDGQFTWPKGKFLFNGLNLSIQRGRIRGQWSGKKHSRQNSATKICALGRKNLG